MERSNIKNSVSKNPKTKRINEKMYIAEEVLGDFMENTSVHGIKYLADGRVEKLFWTSVLFFALVGEFVRLSDLLSAIDSI